MLLALYQKCLLKVLRYEYMQQGVFSKFLMGGDSIFVSPSVPVRDEVKWEGGLNRKKIPTEAKISPKLNLSNF